MDSEVSSMNTALIVIHRWCRKVAHNLVVHGNSPYGILLGLMFMEPEYRLFLV